MEYWTWICVILTLLYSLYQSHMISYRMGQVRAIKECSRGMKKAFAELINDEAATNWLMTLVEKQSEQHNQGGDNGVSE